MNILETLRRRATRVAEKALGGEIERFGGRTIALIDKRRRAQAWFSFGSQLRWLFESRKVDLVIDVGANRGQFASMLRRFHAGDIVSFEPVEAVFGELRAAAARDARWRTERLALGSASSAQTINVASRSELSSLLQPNEYCAARFGVDGSSSRTETLQVRRLDEVLREIVPECSTRSIFLKMDTQGYDTEVFRGAEGILDHVVAMQSEVSLIPIYAEMPHWTESIALYERHGFGIVAMFPITGDARRRVIEYDCLLSN